MNQLHRRCVAWALVIAASAAGCSSAPEQPSGYVIGGVITNLTQSGLVLGLTLSGTAQRTQIAIPAGSTRFAFPQRVGSGTWYSVQIDTQATWQKCWFRDEAGTVESRDVTDVVVFCGVPGRYEVTGRMSEVTRYDEQTATSLDDGRVLVAGGRSWTNSEALASAELFAPSTMTFARTGDMVVARFGHTATLLDDGTVLVVGGERPWGGTCAEIYDPSAGTFSTTGPTIAPRGVCHSATRLLDGRVLIVGGSAYDYLSSAELYDPSTRTFAPTGSLAGVSCGHFGALLPDGKVLVAGGDGLDRAQLYDPTTGTFSLTGSMVHVRGAPIATRLADGSVLVVGGMGPPYGDYQVTAEVYDPVAGTFHSTGDAWACHTRSVALPDGKVFLSGWASGAMCDGPGIDWGRTDGEIYDPATGTFAFTPDMRWTRGDHETALLPDGSVLIVGGVPDPATTRPERFSRL